MNPPISTAPLPRPVALAYAVAAGPVVWALDLLAVYALASLGCARGWPGVNLLGLAGLPVALVAVTLLAEVLIVPAGVHGYRRWRALHAGQSPNRRPGAGVSLEQCLTFSGFLMSAYFALAVLLSGLPALLVTPCR
jgi:hypothetical protein